MPFQSRGRFRTATPPNHAPGCIHTHADAKKHYSCGKCWFQGRISRLSRAHNLDTSAERAAARWAGGGVRRRCGGVSVQAEGRAAGWAACARRIARAHVRRHERGRSGGRAGAKRCRRRDGRRRERVWERRASAPRFRSGTPYLRRMQFFHRSILPHSRSSRSVSAEVRKMPVQNYFLLGIYMSLPQARSLGAPRSTYFGDFLEHFRKKASLMQLRTLFGRLPKRVEMAGVCESLPGNAKTTASDSRARTSRRRDGRRRERASSTPFSDASLMPVGLGDGAARLLCTRITALRRGGETFLWAEPAFAGTRCALIGIRRILT